jgi:ubiquinone/menaquinone biosynthesis C-methylase UbiE
MPIPPQIRDEAESPAHFDACAVSWDASYDEATAAGHVMRARAQAAARLLGDGPGSVLEVGTGSGRVLGLLAERGWSVTGTDPAPRMLELARARLGPGARLVVARAEDLPFGEDRFDAVIAVGVLDYADMAASLRELARVLRPGGFAAISFRNRVAPVHAWNRLIAHPLARAIKRRVSFGERPPMRRRLPLSLRRIRELLSAHALVIERAGSVGVAVLPDPLAQLAPGLAYRSARRAERQPLASRALGTTRIFLTRLAVADTPAPPDIS